MILTTAFSTSAAIFSMPASGKVGEDEEYLHRLVRFSADVRSGPLLRAERPSSVFERHRAIRSRYIW